MTNQTPAATQSACACPAGQVCLDCLGAELVLSLQLKLSLVWATGPAELRERRSAAEQLQATAANN